MKFISCLKVENRNCRKLLIFIFVVNEHTSVYIFKHSTNCNTFIAFHCSRTNCILKKKFFSQKFWLPYKYNKKKSTKSSLCHQADAEPATGSTKI